jgi:hypothetical protein
MLFGYTGQIIEISNKRKEEKPVLFMQGTSKTLWENHLSNFEESRVLAENEKEPYSKEDFWVFTTCIICRIMELS